jgi:hypothetical protein
MSPTYDLRKSIGRISLGVLVLFALFYGGFRAYSLLAGPSITVYSPADGDTVASSTFEISGQVARAKEITVQGRPITIDTEGRFIETLVAQAPYTILVLVATDKYGSTVSKTLRVIPK